MKKILRIAVVAIALVFMRHARSYLCASLASGAAQRRRTAVVVGSTAKAAGASPGGRGPTADGRGTTADCRRPTSEAAAAEQEAAAARQELAVAQGLLPLGTVVRTLPAGCVSTAIGGVEYQHCGVNYYRAVFEGNNLVYVTAQPK